MQKKWIAITAAGLLLVSTMTAQAEELPRRSLTVSGSAEVTAKSDTAAICGDRVGAGEECGS